MKKQLAFFLVLIPLSAQAQNWTQEEQEVIAFIEECKSLSWSSDYDTWFDACWDSDIIYVDPSYSPTSNINREYYKEIRPLRRAGIKERKSNTMPISVKVHGDTAIIYYFVEGIEELENGETREWKRYSSETMIKLDGKWKIINKNDWAFHTSEGN